MDLKIHQELMVQQELLAQKVPWEHVPLPESHVYKDVFVSEQFVEFIQVFLFHLSMSTLELPFLVEWSFLWIF